MRRYFVVIERVSPATAVEKRPTYSTASRTDEPDDVGVMVWNAVTVAPIAVVRHANERTDVHSLTTQVAGDSFGWWMRARDPTASGPGGSSSTLVIESVHVGMRRTSLSTDHTRSGLAAMSTDVSILRTPPPPLLLVPALPGRYDDGTDPIESVP